jgi:uncharacterized membrane protein
MSIRHSRAHIHASNTFGQRAADAIANGMGSWPFIIIQSLFVGVWIVLNVVGVIQHWDVYPFILLNLLFSTQAAYAAPIIMMSQNRQAQKDHLRDDHEADEVDLLFKINQQQLEILHLLRQRFYPDQTVDTARDEGLQRQMQRVEEQARALEDRLGVHRDSMPAPANHVAPA